jgi:hypothetical protein
LREHSAFKRTGYRFASRKRVNADRPAASRNSNKVSNAGTPKLLETMRALTYSDIKPICKQY